MEAGYDYTLLGVKPRRPAWVAPALFLAVLAAALLTAGGAYYRFAAPADANAAIAAIAAETAAVPAAKAARPERADDREPAARPPRLQTSAIAGQQLYPAGRRQAAYWVNPMAYEPQPGRPDTSFRWWAGAGVK